MVNDKELQKKYEQAKKDYEIAFDNLFTIATEKEQLVLDIVIRDKAIEELKEELSFSTKDRQEIFMNFQDIGFKLHGLTVKHENTLAEHKKDTMILRNEMQIEIDRRNREKEDIYNALYFLSIGGRVFNFKEKLKQLFNK